jgi:isocitrate dehydrogenase kinase/phosphatase
MSDQPYSGVSNNDIFPEEFRHFLWLPAPLRTVFEQTHDYLFQAAWWREIQARIRSGEIIDIFPYAQGKRFRRNRGATDSGR